MARMFFVGFLAFAFLFAQFSSAVSSVDAVNFVVSSNYYLYDAETYSSPNVAVKFEDKSYWVIPLTAGPDVVTYFPVESESGQLSVSPAVNRGLFEVADTLREMQLLKASLSQGSGVEWLFTQKYQTIFTETSLSLKDEVYKLNTVDSALKDGKVSADISGLKSSLESMSSLSLELSNAVSEASNVEAAFTTEPSQESLLAMKDFFAVAFGMVSRLNDEGLSYQSGLTKLKNQISVSSLETQTKSQLEPLLRVPQSLSALRNYNLDAGQLKQALDSKYAATSLRLDSLLEQLGSRVAKDRVHKLIYAGNDRLRKETGFDSLSKAHAAIMSQENISMWQGQAKVVALREDYSKALDYYSKKQFDLAEKAALRALDNAAAVYKDGKKQVPPGGADISQDLLFKAAGILIILLVLLYVFNNRKKLRESVSEKPEELDLYK